MDGDQIEFAAAASIVTQHDLRALRLEPTRGMVLGKTAELRPRIARQGAGMVRGRATPSCSSSTRRLRLT